MNGGNGDDDDACVGFESAAIRHLDLDRAAVSVVGSRAARVGDGAVWHTTRGRARRAHTTHTYDDRKAVWNSYSSTVHHTCVTVCNCVRVVVVD